MSVTYAVDLGTTSVKVITVTGGVRGAAITGLAERLIPPGDEPHLTRALAVLQVLLRELGLGAHDNGYWSVYGDQIFTNIIEFEFRNLKRAELERAVGTELENVVPLDLEEMVFAWSDIPTPPPPTAADSPAGRVAAPTNGVRLLTYAMAKRRAEDLIAAGQRMGAEPKGLLPVAHGAARLVEALPSLATVRTQAPVAVVDIGHERTDIVVVAHGKPVFTRALPRAGRAVTEAVARFWNLPLADAERAKHSDGFVASAAEPALSEAWQRIHEVVVSELAPFARDVRLSLAACRARTGFTVGHVLLVGGGARLRGLAAFVAEHLGITAQTLTPEDLAQLGAKLSERHGLDSAAVALGLALDAATGRPPLNLRSGALAQRMDLSFLRRKAVPLAASAMLVLAAAAGSAYANLYRLKKQEKVLALRLAQESTEHFGAAKTVKAILAESKGGVGGASGSAESPLPKLTAYDILLDINSKIPSKEQITLDLAKLDISREKIDLAGTTKKSEEIDALVAALKELKCFGEIGRGATETGENGVKKFTLSIPSTCM